MTLFNAAAAVLLAAAAYAQWSVARLTVYSRVWGTRLLLALVGCAIGFLGAHMAMVRGAPAFAVFLIGFGIVHVPAAIVLLLKAKRGEGRS